MTLGLPTVGTVSSAALVWEEGEHPPVQVDDPNMIAGLLDLYNNKTRRQAADFTQAGDMQGGSLFLRHAQFSFLQFEIAWCYSPKLGELYCRDDTHAWFVLPEEWGEACAG